MLSLLGVDLYVQIDSSIKKLIEDIKKQKSKYFDKRKQTPEFSVNDNEDGE